MRLTARTGLELALCLYCSRLLAFNTQEQTKPSKPTHVEAAIAICSRLRPGAGSMEDQFLRICGPNGRIAHVCNPSKISWLCNHRAHLPDHTKSACWTCTAPCSVQGLALPSLARSCAPMGATAGVLCDPGSWHRPRAGRAWRSSSSSLSCLALSHTKPYLMLSSLECQSLSRA